jgi:glycosyltransferase involved in cell wall biosynthesis
MNSTPEPRIALLYPSVEIAAYWQPVLYQLKKLCENTIFYTGCIWPEFDPKAPGGDAIGIVGKSTRVADKLDITAGYGRGFIYASPNIIFYLLKFKPNVVFANCFSIWTLLAILLKPLGGWKLTIAYEGCSPNVDFRDSKSRLFARRLMAKFGDAFISNNNAGRDYLVEVLGVDKKKVAVKPYLVPEPKALFKQAVRLENQQSPLTNPVFLYVGRIDRRKGINFLLDACLNLQKQGYQNYTLLIIGDGEQREEFENYSKSHGLDKCVKWLGWISYGSLGPYFNDADVFVFPSIEDTWGMVVPEAMSLGKPVLCSTWAGSAEMIDSEKTGYVFDPYYPEQLAGLMRQFIDRPNLITSMGKNARKLMEQYTPETAARFFADVSNSVLER